MIRVAIVDDHPMVAAGFARFISAEDDIELVGVAGTVTDVLALVEREIPHVVLMDFYLPDGDGAEATEKILQRWPQTKVLMLSGGGQTISSLVPSRRVARTFSTRPYPRAI